MAGIQEGLVLIFGTGAATTYGLIQGFSRNKTIETVELKGPDGKASSIQQYGNKEELSLSYLEIVAGTDAPAIGTLFTFDGVDWLIKSIDDSQTVDGFKSVSVIATYYDGFM